MLRMIIGSTGSGKTTLWNNLRARDDTRKWWFASNYTTRPRRENEIPDGKIYEGNVFLTPKEFWDMWNNDKIRAYREVPYIDIGGIPVAVFFGTPSFYVKIGLQYFTNHVVLDTSAALATDILRKLDDNMLNRVHIIELAAKDKDIINRRLTTRHIEPAEHARRLKYDEDSIKELWGVLAPKGNHDWTWSILPIDCRTPEELCDTAYDAIKSQEYSTP